MRGAVLWSLAVVVVATGTWCAASAAGALLWGAVLALPVVGLVLLHRRRPPVGLSPLLVVAVAFVATAGAGLLLGETVGEDGGVSARLSLDAGESARTAVLFVVAALALLVGAAPVLLARATMGVAERSGGSGGSLLERPAGRAAGLLVLGAAIPLLVLIAVDGSLILSRTDYSATESGSVAGVASTIGVAAVLACGFLAASEVGPRRLLPVVLALGYLATYFSLGSRKFALVVPIIAVGVLLARPGRAARRGLLGAGLLGLLLLPLPLYLRGGSSHGLLPYLDALPGVLTEQNLFRAALDNVLFSFPLAGHVAFQVAPIPSGTIMSELSLLPGVYSGWYDVLDSVRVNVYTPYSGIGEIGNLGWTATVVFWIVVGAVLGYAEVRIAELTAAGQRFAAIVLTGLPVLFALFALQYNLRSGCRLLVYLLVADLGLRVWSRVHPVVRPAALASAG